jgi:hypothetical protein
VGKRGVGLEIDSTCMKSNKGSLEKKQIRAETQRDVNDY